MAAIQEVGIDMLHQDPLIAMRLRVVKVKAVDLEFSVAVCGDDDFYTLLQRYAQAIDGEVSVEDSGPSLAAIVVPQGW